MEANRKKSAKTPAIPFHVFIAKALEDADVTNVEAARRLGYPKPNVISMMKKGAMKVPLSRIGDFADLVKMDRLVMLRAALSEYDPGLLDTLNKVVGRSLVTKNELAMLEVIRSGVSSADIDLVKDDEFVIGLQTLVGHAAAKQAQQDLLPSPETKNREGKLTRANDEIQSLLLRQAREREKLYNRISEEVGVGLMSHRRIA